MGTRENSLWRRTLSTHSAASTGEPGTDHTMQFNIPCAGSSSRQGAVQTWSAMSLSSTTGCKRTMKRHLRCGALGRSLLVLGCLAAALDRRQRAMHACRTLHRKCVETRRGHMCWVSGEDEALWYGRAIAGFRDLWMTGRRQMYSAARMLSDDGEHSWKECSSLHKQTHTCERWALESQSDLLLSLLCCWQSRVCIVFVCLEVFAVRLS